MPRIFPSNWKTQLKIFEMYGCKYKRKEGSHHVLTCPGAKRAVVIPENVVVMLDSCFSGTGGRSVTSAGARPLVISIENPLLTESKIMVLAASTGNQISSDYDKVQHGLFTYYLLKGMRGEADADGNGIVELIELYEYVKTNVSEKASIELNRDQIPLLLPQLNAASKSFKIPIAKTK